MREFSYLNLREKKNIQHAFSEGWWFKPSSGRFEINHLHNFVSGFISVTPEIRQNPYLKRWLTQFSPNALWLCFKQG